MNFSEMFARSSHVVLAILRHGGWEVRWSVSVQLHMPGFWEAQRSSEALGSTKDSHLDSDSVKHYFIPFSNYFSIQKLWIHQKLSISNKFCLKKTFPTTGIHAFWIGFLSSRRCKTWMLAFHHFQILPNIQSGQKHVCFIMFCWFCLFAFWNVPFIPLRPVPFCLFHVSLRHLWRCPTNRSSCSKSHTVMVGLHQQFSNSHLDKAALHLRNFLISLIELLFSLSGFPIFPLFLRKPA